jgi:hypothetical protein
LFSHDASAALLLGQRRVVAGDHADVRPNSPVFAGDYCEPRAELVNSRSQINRIDRSLRENLEDFGLSDEPYVAAAPACAISACRGRRQAPTPRL